MSAIKTPVGYETMHLSIDATCLGGPRSGVWTYAWEVLSRLPPRYSPESIDLFLGQKWVRFADYGRENGTAPQQGLRSKLTPTLKRVPGVPWLWETLKQHAFQKGLRDEGDSLLWAPCFLPPTQVRNSVLTVHDLSHVRFPDCHPAARMRWLNGLGDALEAAQSVIAVSEFTRSEIIDVYKVPAHKITTILNGINERYCPQDPEVLGQALARFGVQPGGYILSVCTLEPRKNLSRLIEAYGRLPRSLQRAMPLLLVGGAGWGDAARKSVLEKIPVEGEVRVLGYVSSPELPALYAGCAAFAYPALYEGFGLPVAEALACGASVVMSSAEALVEVAGGHAWIAPPDDTGAWVTALEQALTQTVEQRAEQGQRNAAFAARYQWAESARAHADLFARLGVK